MLQDIDLEWLAGWIQSASGKLMLSGRYLCTPATYAPTSQTSMATTSDTIGPVSGVASTVAAGSNGGEISTIASWSSPSAGVLGVASGTPFPPGGGTVNVAASGPTTAIVTYTAVSGNTLTGCAYVSGSATGTVSTGGAVTLTSAVCSTGSFTAPPSGSVVVEVSLGTKQSAAADIVILGLCATGTITPIVGSTISYQSQSSAGNQVLPVRVRFLVTGLNPGTSFSYDLMYATSAGTLTVVAYAQSSTTPGGSAGLPIIMTVQAV